MIFRIVFALASLTTLAQPPKSDTAPEITELRKGKMSRGYAPVSVFNPEDHDHSITLEIGALTKSAISADTEFQQRTFDDIYRKPWTFVMTLSYEWYFNPSDSGQGFGIYSEVGYHHYEGIGRFGMNLTNAGRPSDTFGEYSNTKLTLDFFPIKGGLVFNQKLFSPIGFRVAAGPSMILYSERRSDGKDGTRGYGWGYFAKGGPQISLGTFNPKTVSDFQFLIEASLVNTFSGPVDFQSLAVLAGFGFSY